MEEKGIPYTEKILQLHHEIPINDMYALEQYINRCISKQRALSEWMTFCEIRSFLESFIEVDHYRFPQKTHLITFPENKGKKALSGVLFQQGGCQLPEHPSRRTQALGVHS